MSSSRRSSAGTAPGTGLRVSANESLQNSMPVQAIRFLRQCERQRRQAQRVQAPDKAVDHVVGDIQNGQRTPRRHHRKTSRCGGGGVRKTRMAWTADRDRAEWFQHRYQHTDKPGKVWTITVGPDRLLAHYHERHRGEDEHVIDPSSRLRIVMRRWPVCFGTSSSRSSWRPRQPRWCSA